MGKVKELLVERRMTPVETEFEGKDIYFQGIILQSDLINGNGRYYPAELMEEAVEEYKARTMSNGRNTAWGALDHPENPELKLSDVSHRFIEITRSGNNWFGKAIIGDTDKGRIAKELIKMGGTLGTSSRASGEVAEGRGVNGSDLVTSLDFITVGDIVANPSAPDAYVDSIMENTKWILESGVWKEKSLHKAQKKIKQAKTKSKLQESKMEVAHALFNSINKILNK